MPREIFDNAHASAGPVADWERYKQKGLDQTVHNETLEKFSQDTEDRLAVLAQEHRNTINALRDYETGKLEPGKVYDAIEKSLSGSSQDPREKAGYYARLISSIPKNLEAFRTMLPNNSTLEEYPAEVAKGMEHAKLEIKMLETMLRNIEQMSHSKRRD